MKKTVVSLLIFLITYQTNSIYFGISSDPFCFDLEQQVGKTIKFSYEVTGQTPEEVTAQILPSTGQQKTFLTGSSNKTMISGDYQNNVCFISTDKKYKSISIDFYTQDKAHLMELAKKSEIYELHAKIIQVGENLKQIAINEEFEEQRQIIHSQIIVKHENTIKYFAVGKLLLIILVTLGQLYLLKSMLNKTGRGYMPL